MAKEPLQALLFKSIHWHDILSGYKSSTLRDGTVNYRVSKPVMLCCHRVNVCLMATVTRVTHCLLEEIPKSWLVDRDYPWQRYLLEMYMQKFYPDIKLTSPITLIEWLDVRGAMIGRN